MNYPKNKRFILLLLVLITTGSLLFAKQTNHVSSNTSNSNQQSMVKNTSNTNYVKNAVQSKKNNSKSFLMKYFEMGGPFMYPLLILSIICFGIVMERFCYFSRKKLNIAGYAHQVVSKYKKEGKKSALAYCKKSNSNIAKILQSGLTVHMQGIDRVEKTIETNGRIEISLLERGLSILSAIANLAPLLGFLGTVTGMIAAFQAIASADTVSAKLVSVGIFEALITTAVGLIVAIPAFAFHNVFVHKIDRFATEVEQSAAEIIHVMALDTSNDPV